jgi:hypothetical protein
MTPVAHLLHWYNSLLYLAPILIVIALLRGVTRPAGAERVSVQGGAKRLYGPWSRSSD